MSAIFNISFHSLGITLLKLSVIASMKKYLSLERVLGGRDIRIYGLSIPPRVQHIN